MKALIDGDAIAYRCAASCKEGEGDDIAILRADKLIRDILDETQSDEYLVIIGGEENFRKEIDPLYKANRIDVPRPKSLDYTKLFLVEQWNAKVTDGIEADDLLGILQDKDFQEEKPYHAYGTVMCAYDKDLKMIPGIHYNFVKKEWDSVSYEQGIRTFYLQMLCGDRADNITGFDGKMRQSVPQFIEKMLLFCETEQEMFDTVREAYNDDERFFRNGKLLWIMRTEGDIWNPQQLISQSQFVPEVEAK